MNISNFLTVLRIFIGPLFFILYSQHASLGISPEALPYLLLILIAVAELSDAFDGYLARKLNQVTELGKVFDPMADSIYRLSIFLIFTMPPVSLPLLLIFVFLYRDSIISMLRTICALKGFALAARNSGKLKAVLQAIAIISIVLLMIPYSLQALSLEDMQKYSFYLTAFVAFYTVLSGVEYLMANRVFIKKILVKE
jgi:CDP-diacylglycerol---glycerol-3-phosphate 3-phosphatidyltransferase